MKEKKDKSNQVEGFTGKYSTPNYGDVNFKVRVVDGVALWWFSDRRLAKDFYNVKKINKADVTFRERLNSVGERFKNKTKEEILKIIAKEHQGLIAHNKK